MLLPHELVLTLLALAAVTVEAKFSNVIVPRHRTQADEHFVLRPRALVRPLTGKAAKLRDPATLAPGSLNVAGGCRNWWLVQAGDTCYGVVEQTGVASLKQFYAWNPSLNPQCFNLIAGRAYCVSATTQLASPSVKPPASVPSTSSAVATPTSGTSNGVGASYTGDATWFVAGLGACGTTVNGNVDRIVAVSWRLYDTYPGATSNPNTNPICGRRMKVSYGAKSVVVTVQDRCGDASCAMNDVDLSQVAFQDLASLDVGRMPVTVRSIPWQCCLS